VSGLATLAKWTRHLQGERKDKHYGARGRWVWTAADMRAATIITQHTDWLFSFHGGRTVDTSSVWRATVVFGLWRCDQPSWYVRYFQVIGTSADVDTLIIISQTSVEHQILIEFHKLVMNYEKIKFNIFIVTIAPASLWNFHDRWAVVNDDIVILVIYPVVSALQWGVGRGLLFPASLLNVVLMYWCADAEQSLSVEDKVLLAQAASERAAIVAKYDKVRRLVSCYWLSSWCHVCQDI